MYTDVSFCYMGPCHYGMTRSRIADEGDGI